MLLAGDIAYSVQVLAQPHGFWKTAIEIIQWVIWGLFVLDYIAKLGLATDRLRWFVRHLVDLAIHTETAPFNELATRINGLPVETPLSRVPK